MPDPSLAARFGLVLTVAAGTLAAAGLVRVAARRPLAGMTAAVVSGDSLSAASGPFMAAAVALAFLVGPDATTAATAALAVLALREWFTLTGIESPAVRLGCLLLLLPLQFALADSAAFDAFVVVVPLAAALALPLATATERGPRGLVHRSAYLAWGLLLCIYCLSCLPALAHLPLPPEAPPPLLLVLYVVVVAGSGPAFARIARRMLSGTGGRGGALSSGQEAVLALAFGTGVGALLGWLTPFEPTAALAVGALVAACGTAGARVLRLVPGPEGPTQAQVLERMAPAAFAAPVLFHLTRAAFSS